MIQYIFSSRKANIVMGSLAMVGILGWSMYAAPRAEERTRQEQKANAEFKELNERFQHGIDSCFQGTDGNPRNGIQEPAEIRDVARLFGYEGPVNYGTQIILERGVPTGHNPYRPYFDSTRNAVVLPEAAGVRNALRQWEDRGCKF